jgi:hypothetical protein
MTQPGVGTVPRASSRASRLARRGADANQMRLFLHIGAHWLMRSLRAVMPRRSFRRVAQSNKLHLPRATLDQAIFAMDLNRWRSCFHFGTEPDLIGI